MAHKGHLTMLLEPRAVMFNKHPPVWIRYESIPSETTRSSKVTRAKFTFIKGIVTSKEDTGSRKERIDKVLTQVLLGRDDPLESGTPSQ